MLKRLLRTLAPSKSLQEFRRQSQLKLSKDAIRERIQSLYNEVYYDTDNVAGIDPTPSFSALRRDNATSPIQNCSTLSLFSFIQNNLKCEDIQLYNGYMNNILISISSSTGRKSAAELIKKTFKPFAPNRHIPIDGLRAKSTDWIIMDFGSTRVHILDPQKRIEIELDEKILAREEDEVFNLEAFINKFRTLVPKSITCKPDLVDKYLNKRRNSMNQ